MKNNLKKRIIASILCVILASSYSVSVLADATSTEIAGEELLATAAEEPAAVSEEVTETPAPETPVETPVVAAAAETPAVETPAADPVVEEPAPVQEDTTVTEPVQTEPVVEEPVVQSETPVTTQDETPVADPTEAPVEVTEDETQVINEWTQTVGSTVVKVTAAESVIPSSAKLLVKAITDETQVKEIQEAVEQKAIEEKIAIKSIAAYDISFADEAGNDVQPNGTVNVTVENPDIEQDGSDESLKVMHVDENTQTATVMPVVGEESNAVEFETTHFSQYVIVNEDLDNQVTVKVEHYLKDGDTVTPYIFKTDKQVIAAASKLTGYTKENSEYKLEKIVKVIDNGTEEVESTIPDQENILIVMNTTLRVYYSPITTATVEGTPQFFDYDNGLGYNTKATFGTNAFGQQYPSTGNINVDSNYDASDSRDRLMVGANNDWVYSDTNRKLFINTSVSEHGITAYINRNNGGDNISDRSKRPIVSGILTGVAAAGTGDPIFKYNEPGLFTSDAKEGKTIVTDDIKLQFSKEGSTYEFLGTNNLSTNGTYKRGTTSAADGRSFFPLNFGDTSGTKNEFFGMRYDFTFTIGDYNGLMNYTFQGDDDLWVCLDGEVILDLGGIHSRYPDDGYGLFNQDAYADGKYQAFTDVWPNTVNIWEKLGIQCDANGNPLRDEDGNIIGLSDDERKATHRITILYMERGGGDSGCNMDFVLPNVSSVDPTIVPVEKATLTFKKVNSAGTGLGGAKFALYKDTDTTFESPVGTAESATDGTVTFSELTVGNYVLKETAAPPNYVAVDRTWDVVVSINSSGETVAVLKDGNNVINEITNKTGSELLKEQLEYDKTAQLVSWDDRIYKLELTANSISQYTLEGYAKAIDVVLVLDVSGSMNTSVSESGRTAYSNLNKNTTYYYSVNNDARYRDVYEVTYNQNTGRWQKRLRGSNGSYTNLENWDYSRSYYTEIVTRLDSLKSAVSTFVNTLAISSPESKVAVVSYSSSDSTKEVIGLTSVGTGSTSIMEKVNALTAVGSTYPSSAITRAGNLLATSGNDKHVIFLTDGDCGQSPSNPSSAEEKRCKDAATILRENNNIQIHAIRFATTAAGYLSEVVSDTDSSGNPLVYSATDTESLVNSFNLIISDSVMYVPVAGATVIDYIDNRFIVTDADGTPLTDGATITAVRSDGETASGTLHIPETGMSYIEWRDQTIQLKDGQTPGWKTTFYVKAKDTFIGGNNIPTNGDGSGITTANGGTGTFPKPTVNVKAELVVANKAVTIYKGDTLPDFTTEVLNKMFNHSYVDFNGELDRITIKWYSDEDCTTEVTEASADASGTYYLQVIYDAGAPTTGVGGSNANSTIEQTTYIAGATEGEDTRYRVYAVNDGTDVDDDTNTTEFANVKDKNYGVYKVEVISGTIQLTKTLEEASDEEQTFNFTVNKLKEDGTEEEFTKLAIKVPANADSATYDGDALTDLARGTYIITEDDNSNYSLQDVTVVLSEDGTKTNTEYSKTDESVTFALGYEVIEEGAAQVDVIKNYTYDTADGGTRGVATFTNAEVIKKWDIAKRSTSSASLFLEGAEFTLETIDGISYYGKSDDKGVVTWYTDAAFTSAAITSNNLPKGTYELKETKAPAGYSKSEVVWTVEVAKGGLKSISAGTVALEATIVGEGDNAIAYFYYENTPVYALPQAGGAGIFTYMISGLLLMFAAALILYKTRCKGVLRN